MQHRPLYHFLPKENWMNDPNGPIYFNGEHHLFYQHNPTYFEWGNLHWGHATSKDLIHWEHKPIALYPDKKRGELHCFSGCSYVNNGKIELFYTSVSENERSRYESTEQWVATTEDMVRWHQIPSNPILKASDHKDFKLTEWRDPFVFKYKGETFLLLAGIVNGKQGCIHIYKSNNMRNWEYLNKFFTEDELIIYECPNAIVFGDKIVLLHSILNTRIVRYYVGTMNNDYTLNILNKGFIDYGDYFATNISFDDKGRAIMWGWIREDARANLVTDGEWAGVQALPRIIELEDNNTLKIKRLPEADILRQSVEKANLQDFTGTYDFSTKSNTAEIYAEIDTSSDFMIKILCSDDGREHTDIIVSPSNGTFRVALDDSSLLSMVHKGTINGKFQHKAGKLVKIDVLVDRSVIEIFINEKSCLTARAYPTLTSGNIKFYSMEKLRSAKINVWELSLDSSKR